MKTSLEIKALFDELSLESQRELLEDLLLSQELEGKVLQEATQEVVKKRNNKPCPHCSSTKVYKRGKQKGVQMYRCNTCSKWYSETTGTPLYDIKLKIKMAILLKVYGARYADKENSDTTRYQYSDQFRLAS